MARYKFLLLCYFLLRGCLQNLHAQDMGITGVVRDAEDKQAVVGAVVRVGSNGTATNASGRYELMLTGTGGKADTLVVSHVGYNDYYQVIYPEAGKTLLLNPVLLVATNKLLNQVVVSAGRYEQSVKRSTVSTEVIKPYMIQNRLTTNMDKLLDNVPSVSVVDGQINIRNGSGWTYGAGSRVMVLLDDMPFLTGDAGQVKWNFVPVENVQQVEVIKGASSVLYGSSALNGIVHFRTQLATDKPIVRINVFGGGYAEPKRSSLKWSKSFQKQYGFNTYYSFKRKMVNMPSAQTTCAMRATAWAKQSTGYA